MKFSRQDTNFLLDYRALLRQHGLIVSINSLSDLANILNITSNIKDYKMVAYRERLLQILPKSKRLYLEPPGIITCEQCGHCIEIQIGSEPYNKIHQYIVCSCNEIFQVITIEQRAYPRKPVYLPGIYFYGQEDKRIQEMVVEDLSYGGALIKILAPHTIMYNDCLIIHFTLDDVANTIISEPVRVKRVQSDMIGVEFVNTSTLNHALAVYFNISWIKGSEKNPV